MHIVLLLINVLCMALILFIKHKKKFKTTKGKNVLLGFGIFFSIGSIVLLEVKEGSIFYSVLAIIVYIIYITKSKILLGVKFSDIKTEAEEIKDKQINKMNENINKQKENIEKIKSSVSDAKVTNKKKTKPSTVIGALIIVGFICAIVSGIASSDMTSIGSNQARNLLVNDYSLSEEKADTIINTINKCGFSNYSLEVVGEENGIHYFIIRQNNSNISGGLNIKDGKVLSIDYASNILYENEAVQHTLSEYIVTSDEKVDLVYETQDVIKNILKSPSTAKFPWVDEWAVGKKNGSTIVQGYVDSQNGFGATVRSTFQVTYTNSTVTSLIFDGTEYMK